MPSSFAARRDALRVPAPALPPPGSTVTGPPEVPAPAPPPAPRIRSRHVLVVGPTGRSLPGKAPATLVPHTAGLVAHLERSAASLSVHPAAVTSLPGRGPAPGLVLGIVPGLAAGLAAARVAGRRSVPLLLVVHDLVTGRPAGRYRCHRLRLAEAIERRLLPLATEVAVLSPDLRVVVQTLGVPASRVHLVPPWTSSPPGGPDRDAARRALGWAPHAFTVVHPVPDDAHSDPATALAALRLLDGAADLVLTGDAARCTAARARLRGGPPVRVVAPTDGRERRVVLAAADLLLLAERADSPPAPGPSLTLVECLGAGRPVLAATPDSSRVAAELDRSAGAGLVVSPGDPVLLAAAVRALQLDDDLRTAMGATALGHARERFDRRNAMSRLDAVVEAALARA